MSDFSDALNALTDTYEKIDATKQSRTLVNAQASALNAENVANGGNLKLTATANNTALYLGGGALLLILVGVVMMKSRR